MSLATQNDLILLSNNLGSTGIEVARRLFPQVDDPLNTLGAIAGAGTCRELGNGLLNRTLINFSSRSLSMTDEAGVVAYGGTKVYDFPAGNILILGCTADLTIVKSGAGINTDFDGDFGVGTITASNNNSLASTEQNIIPTTATPQAASGATTAKGINAAAIAPLDGTATAIDMYLNFLIDDADQDITGGGASSLLISGLLAFLWVNLGQK